MDIDYKHVGVVIFVTSFVAFYVWRHFYSDVQYISKALAKLLQLENANADAGDMAGDLQAVAAAKRVSEQQTRQRLKDEELIAAHQGNQRVLVLSDAFSGLQAAIYARFKEVFIELNTPDEIKPHMLSMASIADVRCFSTELSENAYANSVWCMDERKLYLRYDHFSHIRLELTIALDEIGCEILYLTTPPVDFDFDNETEALIDTLTSLSETIKHDNNGNTYWCTVESLVYTRGVRSEEDFLLGFSNSDTNRYFINPMAFGQAMVEGNFTVEDFNAADVHHYFTISTEHPDLDHVTFNVNLRTYPDFREGSFATSVAKSIHDVPPMFHQLGLIEYMFYWYQLGIVMRTMFVRKNPELLITLHDNVWSNS